MSHNHESLRERTMNNENLAGPRINPNGVGNDRNNIHDRTLNNENLSPDGPLEKDFSRNSNGVYHNEYRNGYHQHLDGSHDSDLALKKIQTAGSISITPELFEKLYLSPQNNVKGDLRRTFGNPTPIALIGFLISLFPLSMALMGWRGAGNSGASGVGSYFFFGGLLMILGSVGEWIIGNTFPFVVFGSFGAYWLAFAATLTPMYDAFGAYSTTGTPAAGLNTVGFRSGFAFFLVSMGLLCLIYLICSLRTNMVFFMIFFCLVLTFAMLTGAYLQLNNGNIVLAGRLQVAGGAFAFATCVFGWWIFFAIMLASLDFPFEIPVGDLSGFIKGASERNAAEKNV
ncbi:GPR1/FUN34/YaaH-class plasma membrane protein-like protein [Massarina eburnea CBS 473.64]|uniref:GPR1/FUN34/YaaH-class plasma membrane protein-like protein n=1 Tax=Massarina eburnea CBS 473.64 TaxID=1395130 RepID=A0A6A6RQA0_9PLEO|nr:GPR1/FUN34/YaaH-class plasma membrane protein-like protein [Massarina eburnea CBS 473.64]